MKINLSLKALWRELGMFVWVMCAVLVIGMSLMYSKAIVLTIQDLVWTDTWSSLQLSLVPQNFDVLNENLEDLHQKKKDIDLLVDQIDYRGASAQQSLGIEDYLDAKMNEYSFSFNDLPPWRRLMISSIQVDAPIVDVPYASEEKLQNWDFDEELRQGVVKYPFTVEPGKTGNSLLFWHSSVTAWEDVKNPFGYVFYKLQDLAEGETFEVIWDGHLYSYVIDNKIIKEPSEVGEEIETYDQMGENFLTLMACYPRLTDAQRILVRAKQTNTHTNHYSNIFALNQ